LGRTTVGKNVCCSFDFRSNKRRRRLLQGAFLLLPLKELASQVGLEQKKKNCHLKETPVFSSSPKEEQQHFRRNSTVFLLPKRFVLTGVGQRCVT
jgi:hypothetical protein